MKKLETLPNWDDADNPLIIGTALHHGLENGVNEAISEYLNSYPVITDKHEEEALKLEYLIPKGKEFIPPDARFEVEIQDGNNFIGYLDLLYKIEGEDAYGIKDFKYSNHKDKYLESRQLHIYKYFAEKILKIKVKRLSFIFFPKIQIRLKKTETTYQFRERLKDLLEKAEVEEIEVPYNEEKVHEYFDYINAIDSTEKYEKNQCKLCGWCEYQKYCEEGDSTMILPSSERRALESSTKKVMWIYGAPFSGKTYLADKFPKPLMLNTDGNIKYVTAPYVPIRNEVTTSGRITTTKMAWEVFKDVIAELEKKQNDFQTIVVDLLEDCYEHCRLYMYQQMGISHESDDAFKAWDKVRTEFLSTIKRLMAMDYDNIILLSHEDSTKDITKRSGDKITSVKPNIADKVATKIAGMVDIVIRCVVIDGKRLLTFKTDEVVFGGGRLTLHVDEIPNTYEDLIEVYEEGMPNVTASKAVKVEIPKAEEPKAEKPEATEEVKPVEKVEDVPVTRTPRTRRTRS